ncbi:hypothetical protein [Haloprofundus salilacus]|uniref:hypothetical protein n=1 Tax=Haloprofundus salilacus TaxID=2876190 RepID=UPI001CD01955|nr:hypothetical protein [Haloprofundus salilacus]
MKAVYALLVTVLVVVATAPAAASVSTASSASTAESTEQIEPDGESELGDNVTAFVQSTTAETQGVVANEKWEAEFERSGDQRAVERRIDRLEAELVELRDRREALAAAAENGSIPEPIYYGRLGQLDGELSALATSIDATEAAADRVGANASRLSTLRAETRETHASIAGPGETVGPSEQAPNRANGTGNTDGTSESRQLVDTAVGTAVDGPETPTDDSEALGHGAEDGGDAEDATRTERNDEQRRSPGGETSPVDSTARVDGEALGKEDVRSLDS